MQKCRTIANEEKKNVDHPKQATIAAIEANAVAPNAHTHTHTHIDGAYKTLQRSKRSIRERVN